MKLSTLGALLSFLAALVLMATTLNSAPSLEWYLSDFHLLTADNRPAFAPALIALLFIVWGLYALAAAGVIAALPLMTHAIYGITALYLVRGLFLLPQLMGHNIFSTSYAVSESDLLFSAGALIIGIIHWAGLPKS